jgi:hypothetical protein
MTPSPPEEGSSEEARGSARSPGSNGAATLALKDHERGGAGMVQHGQMLKLKTRGADGKPTWAYRYRVDGRGSARPQVGGFTSQGEALQALKAELERLRRRNGRHGQIMLSQLADEYLAQHEAEPRTIAKLRWLWRKRPARSATVASSTCDQMRSVPGGRRCPSASVRGHSGAAPGTEPRGCLEDHRHEPSQGGCRQSAPATPGEAPVRVVGLIDALAEHLGPIYGPMIVFAAATGCGPANGSRSSSATSTATRESSTCAGHSRTAG